MRAASSSESGPSPPASALRLTAGPVPGALNLRAATLPLANIPWNIPVMDLEDKPKLDQPQKTCGTEQELRRPWRGGQCEGASGVFSTGRPSDGGHPRVRTRDRSKLRPNASARGSVSDDDSQLHALMSAIEFMLGSRLSASWVRPGGFYNHLDQTRVADLRHRAPTTRQT